MKNQKNLLWDVFTETGDIEVYLKYKECSAEGENKSGDEADANEGAHNEGN